MENEKLLHLTHGKNIIVRFIALNKLRKKKIILTEQNKCSNILGKGISSAGTYERAGQMDYKQKIIEMVENINNQDILKRIYELAQYLYIHKEK